ncbi:MAG: hypothetical protein RLZZ428_431 [Pseudomonadota bacterium]
MNKTTLSTLWLLLGATLLQAQTYGAPPYAPPYHTTPSLYIGVAASSVDLRNMWDDGYDMYHDQYDQNALTLIGGIELSPNLAIESRYMISSGDAQYEDLYGLSSPKSFNNDFENTAIYLKPLLPMGYTGWTLYGLLGYGQTSYHYENTNTIYPAIKASGFQYGVGSSFALTQYMEFFIDYTVLAKDDGVQHISSGSYADDVWDVEGHSIHFGVTFRF